MKVTDQETGVVYSGQANGRGEYRINNFPAGTYNVEAAVPGFAPSVVKELVVNANNVQTQDIALRAAGNTTIV